MLINAVLAIHQGGGLLQDTHPEEITLREGVHGHHLRTETLVLESLGIIYLLQVLALEQVRGIWRRSSQDMAMSQMFV